MVLEYVLGAWLVFVYIMEAVSFKFNRDFLGNMRRHSRPIAGRKPFASVITPCKGLEYGLEENVKAFLNQSYPKYENIFVVESFSDPAYRVLKKFSKRKNVRILISRKIRTCSGKVAAMTTGAEKTKGEVLVFGDADIRPAKDWLASLVEPLSIKGVGATTGYRHYLPAGGLVSCLKTEWNTAGVGIMFGRYSFIWGGSFALKREIFNRLEIIKKWKTAIADDIPVTWALRKNNLKIFFVPNAVSPSPDETDWAGLKEWTSRQMFFVRHNDTRTWKAAFYAYGFLSLVPFTGILSLLLEFFNPLFLYIGMLLLLTQAFTIIRSYSRDRKIENFMPEHKNLFRKNRAGLLFASMMVKFMMVYNIYKTARMEKITWKGRDYTAEHVRQRF